MRRLVFFSGGLLCGLIIGATIVLLLKLESDDAMRADMKNRFDDMLSDVHRASEKRRLELEVQLASMINPTSQTAVKLR